MPQFLTLHSYNDNLDFLDSDVQYLSSSGSTVPPGLESGQEIRGAYVTVSPKGVVAKCARDRTTCLRSLSKTPPPAIAIACACLPSPSPALAHHHHHPRSPAITITNNPSRPLAGLPPPLGVKTVVLIFACCGTVDETGSRNSLACMAVDRGKF
jgi:hypothetical protein